MKQSYTFLSLAEEILSESEMPMTINDIWDSAVKKWLDRKLGSEGKTPVDTLRARLYTNVQESEDKKRFVIVSRNPTLFWLVSREKEFSEEFINKFYENQLVNNKTDDETIHERKYHQVLTCFLNSCPLGSIKVKTIFHEKAKKGVKGQDKWLFPDMVGVSFIFSEGYYKPASIELMKLVQYPMCKFYSFELKKSLDFSNYKKSYFQAVSNSSWANEGYLVCIDIDEDAKGELKRLRDSFGIGLIQLNLDNINDSLIIYPATTKSMIDISTMNLLVNKSQDFEEFVKNVQNSIKLNELVNKDIYDKVLDDNDINKYLLELKSKNDKN